MKLTKLFLSLLLALPVAVTAQAELESRVDALEERAMLDIFNFSGNLGYMYDNRKVETDAGAKSAGNFQRMTFGLNANAKPYENLSVFTTLRMTKFVNTIFGDKPASNAGLTPSRDYNGAQLYVEKAYADYGISDNLIFSFGRLPTIDGVPVNYKYGKPVMGTYPLMAYAATLDGLALTYKAMDNLAIRLVYSPFSANPFTAAPQDFDNDDGGGALPASRDEDSLAYTFNGDNHNAEVITLMLDYNSSFGWTNNFNAVFQYTAIPEYDLYNAARGTASSTAAGIYSETTLTTLHFEAMNILNSDVNVSLSHLQAKAKTTGLGAFASYDSGDQDGQGTLLAVQYSGLGDNLLGLNVISSNEAYGKFDSTNDDIGSFTRSNGMESFISTVGTGADLYVTHRFEPTFSGTFGVMTQDIDAVNWGAFGITTPNTADTAKKKIETIYAKLNLDF